MLPAGGRQHRGCFIAEAVTHSLVLYHKRNTQSSVSEDGQNNSPIHVELTGIINKSLLLYLRSWLSILFISMMHGQANIR